MNEINQKTKSITTYLNSLSASATTVSASLSTIVTFFLLENSIELILIQVFAPSSTRNFRKTSFCKGPGKYPFKQTSNPSNNLDCFPSVLCFYQNVFYESYG